MNTLTPRLSPASLRSAGKLSSAALALLLATGNVSGQSSYTWNGGSGSTGNWSDGANWGGSGPANPQAFLNFNGAARTSSTNDFTAGAPGYQIYFKSGANAFTLYGNAINFYDFGGTAPNIQNEGAFTNQTINFPVVDGNTSGTFGVLNINTNPTTAQGPLTFNGTVSAADAAIAVRAVNVYGSNVVTFNGIISDFSSSGKIAISQLGSGTTILTATNTYTGDTTVNAGTLRIATNSALANSGNFIRLGDTAGTTGANLNLNGGNNLSTPINVRSGSTGTKIIANTAGTAGAATFGGNLFLDADATLFANSTGGNILSGSTLDLKNQTLTIDGTGSNVISGTLQQSTGNGKLVKNNTGTLYMSAASSHTGGTTINAGIVQVNSSGAFGTGSVTMNTSSSQTKMLLNGVIVTNNMTLSSTNPGVVQGVIQALDNTSSTNSGIITFTTNTVSGGNLVGPTTSGLLTMAGAINVNSPGTTLLVRDGRVRFAGGGSYTNMDIRSSTSSLGANNGLATTAVVDIGGNASASVPAIFDLNGFNQTLAGLKNNVTPANLAWVTNSSVTPSTLTLAGQNLVVYGGSIVGNLAINVVSGTQVLSNSAAGNGVYAYSGDTTITNGTLKTGSAGVLPNGAGRGNMIVTNTGIMDLNGVSQTINGLYGNGVIGSLANASATLTVGNTSVNSLFSGMITNAVTITVTNANATLTLDRANNPFTGSVNIGNGSVNFRSGVIRAAATQTLGTGTVSIGTGGNESTARLELSNNISLNNQISLPLRSSSTAPGIENLNGNNTLSGTIALNSGGGFAIIQSDAGTLTIGTAASTAISNAAAASTRNVTLQGASSGAVVGNILDLGTALISLTKDGAGTWALSGVNTYSGDTRIVNGTLVVSNTASLQNSTVDMNVADAGTLNVNNLNATLGGLKGSRNLAFGTGTVSVGNNNVSTNVYSGSLSGNALTKVGSGAWTITGNHTYNGTTTVSAGELIGQTGGSVSNSTVSVSSGATNGVVLATANGQWTSGGLTYSAGTTYADFNFNGNVPSTGTAPFQINGNLAFTVSPTVIIRPGSALIPAGTYPLFKYTGTLSGTAPTTLILPTGMTATLVNNTGNKSIDLNVTVGNAVAWAVGNAAWDINTTANWTNNVSGALVKYLDGQAVVFDDTASGASPITVSLGVTVTPASIVANLTNKSYLLSPTAPGGVFTGSGTLTKNGSGTLTIATTNSTYTGSIILNGGTLTLNTAGSLGTGLITMNNGTTFSVGSGGNAVNPGNNILIASGASVTMTATTLSAGPNGNISSADSTASINDAANITYAGTLSGFTGTFTSSSGTTRLSKGANGDTTLGSAAANFIINSTAPGLQPRNNNCTVNLGSLTGSGTLGAAQTPTGVTFSTSTYSVGALNTSTTFSGKFVDSSGGVNPTTNIVALTKIGSGTLTLSGASILSGATAVNAGALIGTTAGSISNSAVTVNTGATNGVSIAVPGGQFTCSNLTYAAGTEYVLFAFGGNTPSPTTAPLNIQNNLTINGTLNVLITGSPMPLGTYPLIKYTNSLTGAPVQTPLTQPSRTQGYITNDTANKLISYVVTNALDPLVWQPGDGLWDTATANWKDQSGATTTYQDAVDTVLFDETPAGSGPFTVTNNSVLSPSSITVSNATKQYTLASGNLTGPAAFTKNGPGTAILLGTNSYTGGSLISGGTVQANAASLPGSIVDNASLVYDQAVSGAMTNVISGSGSVTKQNSGTLTVANTNTYSGGTAITGGTLQLGDGATRNGAIAGNITNNANLTFANPNTQTFGGIISGSGTVTKNSAGTLNIGGSFTNTYTGLTTVNAGTLGLNSTSPGTNAIGGSLLINAGATVNYTTARDEQIPDTANITNVAGTLTFGARNESFNFLYNNGGTNTVSSGSPTTLGGVFSTNGYFNCTSSGIFQFSNNITIINGYMDITYASTATAGYRLMGPDNTGLIISSNSTTATTFTNQNNASSGARFLFGPAVGQAPVTQVFTSVLNVQDIPGVDPDLNIGLKMTLSSGFNGNIRKDGNGKMAVTIPTSSGFNPTNFIVNQGTIAILGSGTLYFPQTVQVNAGATLDYSGVATGTYALTNSQTFKGNGTIVGLLTNGNSVIVPGDLNSNGLLTVSGDLVNGAGAQLKIDIGGITPATALLNDSTNYDVLAVSGNLTLGGALNVSLLGGFTPAATDSFTIITNGGTLTGAFANLLSGSRVTVSNNVAYSFQVLTAGNKVILTNFSLTAPAVAVNPASTNVVYGNSVALTANALGANPLSYQWYDKNTNAISGETNVTLTLNTPAVAASGNYRVIVTNPYGSATNFASVTITPIGTSVALASSSNPSGYLDALTFTASVTPTNATGFVKFYNGIVPFSTNSLTAGTANSMSINSIARGTNTITAIYVGDGNYLPSTNTLDQVVTNHPPVATLANYYRGAVPTWKIELTAIVTNIADADSDTITVSSLGTSTNGVTLTTGGGFVLYSNTNLVNDQFTYTVDDGNGGSTTGTVNLTALAFITGQSGTVSPGGGSTTVSFAGIPGLSYSVQRSTNLVDWAGILTTNAPSGGVFQAVDDFSDLGVVPTSAYYRLQYNP